MWRHGDYMTNNDAYKASYSDNEFDRVVILTRLLFQREILREFILLSRKDSPSHKTEYKNLSCFKTNRRVKVLMEVLSNVTYLTQADKENVAKEVILNWIGCE